MFCGQEETQSIIGQYCREYGKLNIEYLRDGIWNMCHSENMACGIHNMERGKCDIIGRKNMKMEDGIYSQ